MKIEQTRAGDSKKNFTVVDQSDWHVSPLDKLYTYFLIFPSRLKTHFFSEQYPLISYNVLEVLTAIIKIEKTTKIWTSAQILHVSQAS